MVAVLPQCKQIENLVQITQHFITDIEEVRVLLMCKTLHNISKEVLDTPFDELDNLVFREICHIRTFLFYCHCRSAVLAHIDFHKFVYVFVQGFQDIISCLVTAIQMRLPVVELYLVPHVEKKMNRAG